MNLGFETAVWLTFVLSCTIRTFIPLVGILINYLGNKKILVEKLMCLMCAVEALQEIAIQLGKIDWNFKVNPCNDSSWITPASNQRPLYNNSVLCDISSTGGVCHVVSMYTPFAHITQVILLNFLMKVNGK